MIGNLQKAAALLPAQVCVATLRLIFNGLPTARRMQGVPAPCPLCAGGNDIGHLVACPAFSDFLSHELRLGPPPATAGQAAQWAALLDPTDDSAMRAAIIRNECLVHAYNVIKMGAGGLAPVPLMRARLRQLQVLHSAVWRWTRRDA